MDDSIFRRERKLHCLRFTFCFIAFVVVIAMINTAKATAEDDNTNILPVATIHQLTAQSDIVVLAKVLNSQARFKGKIIVTESQVLIHDVLKGNVSEKQLSIASPGGKVGHLRLKLSHGVELNDGELAVLFLQSMPAQYQFKSNTYYIRNEQGKIPLLGAGFDAAQLKHNRDLQKKIKAIKAQVKQGALQ